MPIVARQPGSPPPTVGRSGGAPSTGGSGPSEDLLPLGGTASTASALAPHTGAGARCASRPSHPPRPPSRRRPVGGAGVRAGGRSDPRPARADPGSARAGRLLRARGVPDVRRARRDAGGRRGRPAGRDRPGARRLRGPVARARPGHPAAGMVVARHRSRPDASRGGAPAILRGCVSPSSSSRTLRDDPADAEMPSHRLLVRAGYVRQLGSGIYSLLPLGKRVNDRVEQVIREEQNAIGGQELEMPVVHPADVWRASGRYDAIGPELTRFKDRNGRDMVLAMTHEEVVALLLADIVKSWRQLPLQVYHFQTKWRDEPRARGGLIRVREFVMKDAYSCDRDEAGLDASYWAQHGAYVRIFERLGLDAIAGQLRRRDDGRQPGPRVHGPQPGRRGRPRPVRGVRLRRQSPGRGHPQARSGPRGRRSARGGRDARHDDHRDAGRVPRHRTGANGQGRVLRDRRRPPGDRHRARRSRGQRDQARQRRRGQGRRHPARHGRGDQGGRHGARLRLADRRPRHGRRRGRPRRALAEPGRGRQPGGLPLPQRQRRARLHAGRRRRPDERPGGRSLPDLRPAR